MSFSLHDEFTRYKFLRWEFLFIQKGLETPPRIRMILLFSLAWEKQAKHNIFVSYGSIEHRSKSIFISYVKTFLHEKLPSSFRSKLKSGSILNAR